MGYRIKLPTEIPHPYGQRYHNRERIYALLDSECLSFSDIGQRVGLTRERIRQIAQKRGNLDGHSRIGICRVKSRLEAAIANFPFLAECQRRGFNIEIPKTPRRTVSINGHIVSIIKMGIVNGYYRISRINRVEIAIFESPDGPFIVPYESMPESSTMFTMKPKIPGAYINRHDWPSFLNAYHLLEATNENRNTATADEFSQEIESLE